MTHPIVEGLTEAVTMAKLMRENELMSSMVETLGNELNLVKAQLAEKQAMERVMVRLIQLIQESIAAKNPHGWPGPRFTEYGASWDFDDATIIVPYFLSGTASMSAGDEAAICDSYADKVIMTALGMRQ